MAASALLGRCLPAPATAQHRHRLPSYSSVQTNGATITGNGTDSSPVMLNLANPNTWTGAQTFNGGATVNEFLNDSGTFSAGGSFEVPGAFNAPFQVSNTQVTLGSCQPAHPNEGQIVSLGNYLELGGFWIRIQTTAALVHYTRMATRTAVSFFRAQAA